MIKSPLIHLTSVLVEIFLKAFQAMIIDNILNSEAFTLQLNVTIHHDEMTSGELMFPI